MNSRLPASVRRRGSVLVVVLLALLGAGVLVTGLTFTSRLDDGLSVAARESQRALAAAELAAWSGLYGLDSTHFQSVRGEERPLSALRGHVDTASASVVRLSDSLFLVVGEGGVRAAGGGLLWRRVGLFVRAALDSAGMVVPTPLPLRSWAELQ